MLVIHIYGTFKIDWCISLALGEVFCDLGIKKNTYFLILRFAFLSHLELCFSGLVLWLLKMITNSLLLPSPESEEQKLLWSQQESYQNTPGNFKYHPWSLEVHWAPLWDTQGYMHQNSVGNSVWFLYMVRLPLQNKCHLLRLCRQDWHRDLGLK